MFLCQEKIGFEAFKRSLVRQIEAPMLTALGESAFEECYDLRTVEIQLLEEVGVKAFKDSGLDEINLPKLKVINENAFENIQIFSHRVSIAEIEGINLVLLLGLTVFYMSLT